MLKAPLLRGVFLCYDQAMVEVVIFDWKRTLYDPESRTLISGAREVLNTLGARGLTLQLVGKDPVGDMHAEASRLGVAACFQAIHFVENTKTDDDIGRYIDPNNPRASIVVGDRVRSEIAVGNRLGAQTVWVERGKFASETPLTAEQVPNYIISDIIELIPLTETI